jgi:outer membrane immunogenic protein
MQIKLLLSLVALVSTTTIANAADTASISSDKWTGFYVGVHGGYRPTIVDFDHYEVGGGGFLDTKESFSVEAQAFGGGGQAGFNYQFDSFVLGLEATYTVGDIADGERTNLNSGFGPVARDREAEIGSMWTVGGRLGYAMNKSLFYAKGGYSNVALSFDNICADINGCFGAAAGDSLGSSSDRVGGYFLGAGYEYKMMEHMGIGVDYTYSRFAPNDQPVSDCCGNDSIDVHLHQIMMNLNLHM